MLTTLTTLMIGFSIFGMAIMLLAYFLFLKDLRKTVVSLASCTVLLLVLTGLQLEHLTFILAASEPLESRLYAILLLTAPPAFYFFSREVLSLSESPSFADLLHLMPIVLGIVLQPAQVAPVAFVIGAGYTLWFARIVYGMRQQLPRFRFEMFFFGLFAVLALLIVVVVLLLPLIDAAFFYLAYANFIGLAVWLIVAVFIAFPELSSDITEISRLTYATSTLGNVDTDEKAATLEALMKEDKVFQNENLNLSSLAGMMDLSGHQLSELINTRFGIGFSRFIREHRVAEARQLLQQDGQASVLSIGLSVGFRSQSNFYTAFREITGETPAAFRKSASETGE